MAVPGVLGGNANDPVVPALPLAPGEGRSGTGKDAGRRSMGRTGDGAAADDDDEEDDDAGVVEADTAAAWRPASNAEGR